MIHLPIYVQAVLGYDGVAAGLAYSLPTLVVAAERLLLRYGPGVVIPLGLVTIGAGFQLMRRAAGIQGTGRRCCPAASWPVRGSA